MKKHQTQNTKLQESLDLQAPESLVVTNAHRVESGAWSLGLSPNEHAHA